MKYVPSRPFFWVFIILILLVITACGGNSSQSDATRMPTVTSIPIYEYHQTEPPQMVTLAATLHGEATPTPDPADIELGRDRYTTLGCNACHGDNGEGTDKGNALAGTTLSEDDFVSFLRSGGTVGVSHQYASNRLSNSRASALYLYVKSLTGGQ